MTYLLRNLCIVLLLGFVSVFVSCDESDPNWDGESFLSKLGWVEETEQMETIESNINLGSAGSLPSSVDLTSKFPPIGDQGAYGTCVAWAVGYNYYSFLNGIKNNYSSSDLAQTSKQFSPKDLFLKTDGHDPNCDGSNFEPAFEAIRDNGIATLDKVPYTGINCSASPSSGTNAPNHKLYSYRKVIIKADEIKSFLAQGKAVVIGAKLGDNFMSCNSEDVIRTETYGYTGQHAYHAMVCCGYDDGKSAFKVINSWAPTWGANGYVWIDYSLFEDEFCFAAFVANLSETNNPDDNNDNVPDDVATGYDLLAYDASDNDQGTGNALDRELKYDGYNNGSSNILASQNWNIAYVAFDAYNAEEYSILLYDEYNSYSNHSKNDWGFDITGPGLSNYGNYVDIPSSTSIASVLCDIENCTSTDPVMYAGYTMPSSLNGTYYLVVIMDAYDAISEEDEDNNYSFVNGETPVQISNGVISGLSKKKAPLKKAGIHSTVTERNKNTYRTSEIRAMLKYHKKSGLLQKRVQAFLANQPKASKSIISR